MNRAATTANRPPAATTGPGPLPGSRWLVQGTKGAIAEVDFFDHREIAGIVWPTRFYERLRKPIPKLPVHDWRMTGLDVNRGMNPEELSGPIFTGHASAPARALATP